MRKWNDLIRERIYNPRDKSRVQEYHVRYMLSRTQQMFRYEGLPETIPQRMLELYLQTSGYCAIGKYDGNLYAYIGGQGGEPDAYYRPTIFTVANPAQNLTANWRIGEECVLVRNDSLEIGMLPLFNRYAYHLTENELSMLLSDINSRVIGLISAGDDRTLDSAKQYLADIEVGKIGVIAENAFLDGIRAQPYAGQSGRGMLTDLIEYEQYLKASWYNEIGLDSNYNMKRESITASESNMNSDALLPLVDDMLKCRQDAMEQVNSLFGTDIRVMFASAWEDNQEQIDIVTEQMEEEVREGGETDVIEPEGPPLEI